LEILLAGIRLSNCVEMDVDNCHTLTFLQDFPETLGQIFSRFANDLTTENVPHRIHNHCCFLVAIIAFYTFSGIFLCIEKE
jgi:hypothetical protein